MAIRFLFFYHLIPFYIMANMIMACEYEDQPRKWGSLSPESGPLMRNVSEDCDFYTFIPKLRPFLAPDIFMKDHNKTRELLKSCFEYMYLFFFIYTKFGGYTFDVLADDIEREVRSTLNLKRNPDLF